MKMKPRQLCSAWLLAGILLFTQIAGANPVYVETPDSKGRGIAGMRGAECMLVLPAHVAFEYRDVEVFAQRGQKGKAEYVSHIGDRDDDLMLFAVTSNNEAICDESEAGMFRATTGSQIIIREKSGAWKAEPITITRRSDRSLEFTFENDNPHDAQGLSGSVIYLGGKPAGIVLELGKEGSDKPNIARHLKYTANLAGDWLLGPGSNVTEIRNALEIIKMATEMRPQGDIGQIAAIENLLGNGSSLSGIDLRGVGLKGVVLNSGELSLAQLHGANLEGALMNNVRAGEARFDFANLRGVTAQYADLRETRFYNATVNNADFSEADAKQSNWGGATARNVNFRGAKLQGASFFMADLTGADFTGAHLEQAFFSLANLTGAKFDGATFDRTDFTAATGDIEAFSDTQRKQMCATVVAETLEITLDRESPSARFSSGVTFQDLATDHLWIPVSIDLLPKCAMRDLVTAGYSALQDPDHEYGHEEQLTEDFFFRYKSDPFDKIGLRTDFREHVSNLIRRVNTELGAGGFLRFEHAAGLTLTEALEDRVDAVRFEGRFVLDMFGNVDLVGLKYEPDSTGLNASWKWKAEYQLEQENEPRSTTYERYDAGHWEKFFPEGTLKQELSENHVQLYQQWTLNRARATPSTAFLSLRISSSANNHLHNALNRARAKPDETVRLMPFEIFAQTPEQSLLVEGGYDSERLFSNSTILLLERPKSAYSIEMDVEALGLLRNYKRIQLKVKILGAEVFDKDPKHPGDHKVIISVQPLELIAFAKDETSLSFDF